MRRTSSILILLAVGLALAWAIVGQLSGKNRADSAAMGASAPVPVEVGAVERGPIVLRRTFSGTLEASAQFVAAPKSAGRIQRITVDLGDAVERGQIVAYLDDEEFVQAVNQAEAELAQARAGQTEAESALEIAKRELMRANTLSDQGVTSSAQLDVRRAEELSSRARVAVTEAIVARAEAALESAKIRLGYARVTADWNEGDDQRFVAERYVDEGSSVSINAPLFSIIDLDPLLGVVNVPERDYAYLAVDQPGTLITDSFPGREFEGSIARIAPAFSSTTRQARVELTVKNAEGLLKPGMFVRATLQLKRVEDAIIVPFDALYEREGVTGLCVLDEAQEQESRTVRWVPVEVGVREGDRQQVYAGDLSGYVVTLGQELCDDGSLVVVANEPR